MSDFTEFMNELQGVASTASTTSLTSASLTSASSASLSASLTSASLTASSRRIKLLLVSTHTNQVNGYSKVAHHLLHELAKHSQWLDVVHFGTQRMVNADLGRSYPSTVRVIDGSAQEKEKALGFAFSEFPATLQAEKPDVVLLYNDLSVLCTYLESIRKSSDVRPFKVWAYLDLSYPHPPQAMMDILNRDVERIFCFTKGWKEHLRAIGATRPIDVLPHAVDRSLYRPIPKEVARQTLGLPKDVFLFTSMNKNIPRKRLDLLIMAFTRLMIRYPTKPLFLLIVADKGDRGGYALFDVFSRELKIHQASVDQFGNRLLITSRDTCYKDEDINLLYNCGDVGVSCAEGEGFGLCSFEQLSLGIPQIAPEIQGYIEYMKEDNSLRIPAKNRYYLPQAHHSVTGEAHVVDPEDVAKAMETYFLQEELRAVHGRKGKDLLASYTWEKVTAPLVKRLRHLMEEEDE